MDRVVTITDARNGITTYAYDDMDRVTEMRYPNGWVEYYTYDKMGRLLAVDDTHPSEKPAKTQKHTYAYDANGNMTYETGVGSHNCDYIYNNLNQQIDRSSDNWKSHTTSAYDKRGNLILEEYIKNKKVTTAGADRYRKEQEAQAALYQRQKDAEAVRYEQEQAAEAAKKAAEAARFAKEQEAAGIAAVGQAEAEAIRAKALAEAEGIDKKAEAMKKYGEAAVIEMIMNALPEIAKNVAEPLSKVDKITMYGEGNSAKLLSDIVNGTTQVTEGISAGMGLDLKSLLAGALGGKLAAGNSQPVQVTVAPQAQPDAAAASADTPEQQV